MIDPGWRRKNINNQVHRIGLIFRWAASEELTSESIYAALKTLMALKKNRSRAKESRRIPKVPDEMIAAVKPSVSDQVWTLIWLQLQTGVRAGELVGLRGQDINMEDEVWVYEPEQHKTAHHNHDRKIYFGPQSQRLLKPYIDNREPDVPLFIRTPPKVKSEAPDLGNH